jgi:hypothetical protein
MRVSGFAFLFLLFFVGSKMEPTRDLEVWGASLPETRVKLCIHLYLLVRV